MNLEKLGDVKGLAREPADGPVKDIAVPIARAGLARQMRSVFINCPFDSSYRGIFDAIVFAVMALGFEVRCALERDTAGQERLEKILKIIRDCQFGIHDISFMGIDPRIGLPRYNMAFELGVFLGCHKFGGKRHAGKSLLILDKHRYRYRKSISDLSGRDIREHGGEPKRAMEQVRDWLTTERRVKVPVGSDIIAEQYRRFRRQLPEMCLKSRLTLRKLTFADYRDMVASWLRANS